MYLFCFLGKSPFSLAVSGILEKKKGDAIRVSLPFALLQVFNVLLADRHALPLLRKARRDEREQIFRVRRRLDVIGAVLVDKIGAVVRLAEARLEHRCQVIRHAGVFSRHKNHLRT